MTAIYDIYKNCGNGINSKYKKNVPNDKDKFLFKRIQMDLCHQKISDLKSNTQLDLNKNRLVIARKKKIVNFPLPIKFLYFSRIPAWF